MMATTLQHVQLTSHVAALVCAPVRVSIDLLDKGRLVLVRSRHVLDCAFTIAGRQLITTRNRQSDENPRQRLAALCAPVKCCRYRPRSQHCWMSAGRRQSALTEQNPRLLSRQSTLSQKLAPKRVPRCTGAMHCFRKPTDVSPDCVRMACSRRRGASVPRKLANLRRSAYNFARATVRALWYALTALERRLFP